MGERIQDLMAKIPGYRGYSEREDRREADKELRDAVAAAYESQVTRITRLQERLINQGDFSTIEVLDDGIGRLQHLARRLRTASYGYSGFFDRTQTYDVADLDRLYAFDLEMANGVDAIGSLINELSEGTNVSATAQALIDKLDELHRVFDQRSQTINTFAGEGSPGVGGAERPAEG
ncbi:MAG TPA: hypothetical protein VER55_05380 [Ardenticatenaceae bacterium]|nr:hypothetical protein [Ardenticatenaceae bacterium]